MKPKLFILCAPIFPLAAPAQQPNTPAASLVINAVDGPAFPITMTVQTNALASALFRGAPNAPWGLLRSATGQLQPGAATFFGDSFDLPLSPMPIIDFDGFLPGSPFRLDANGQGSVTGICPTVGATLAYQAVIADPLSPAGHSLTAATSVTLGQAWTTTTLNLGDDSSTPVGLGALQIPFYGTSYSTIHVCSNGYVTFGSALTDFTPTPTEFNVGPPRIAPFWTDLICPPATVTVTIDSASAPNAPGLVRVDYTNVQDWGFPTSLHKFSMQIHENGLIQIDHRQNLIASIFDQITGIGPGNNLNPVPQKNLSALTAPTGSYVGGANESFIEWFGIIALHPYYTNPYDNPYDLSGRVLTFLPTGAGGLPQKTLQYLMY